MTSFFVAVVLSSSQPIPLYYQLARDLERQIAVRRLRAGDAVPTEAQLCEQYGVSRITVRKAMEDLVAKGLVVRQRGVGSFVAKAGFANRMVSRVASLHDAVAYSEALTFRLLSRDTLPATADLAAALQVAPGASLDRLVRLGSVNNEPVSLIDVLIPSPLARRLPRAQLQAGGSIVRLLEEAIGQPMVKVEQTVVPSVATPEMVQHLGVRPRSPILQITRVYYTSTGTPVEVAVVRYHPQRYSFKIDIVQSAPA